MAPRFEETLIELGRRRQRGWGSHVPNLVAPHRHCRGGSSHETARAMRRRGCRSGCRNRSSGSPCPSGRFPAGDRRVIVHSRTDLNGPARGAEARLVEPLGVDRLEGFPFRGDLVFGEDGVDGADGFACGTVDALVGLDVEHPAALVDAVDRALIDACAVLNVDAWFSDDEGHMAPGYPRPSAGKRWFRYVDLLRGPIARRGASVLVVAVRAVVAAVGTVLALRVIPLAVPVLVALAIALVARLFILALVVATIVTVSTVLTVAAALVALTTAALVALTTAALVALTTAALVALTSAALVALTTAALVALTTAALVALT